MGMIFLSHEFLCYKVISISCDVYTNLHEVEKSIFSQEKINQVEWSTGNVIQLIFTQKGTVDKSRVISV